VVLHQGGILEEADGWFVPPTLILGLDNQHPLSREEVFGPIASVIRFGTEDEAISISIANDSDYGLVGGVWTQNLSRTLRVAGRIEAGRSSSTNTTQAASKPRSVASSKAASGERRVGQH
jgi:acyl-CoA reductase-like NAD-dependent aldehyde dehydrogenase